MRTVVGGEAFLKAAAEYAKSNAIKFDLQCHAGCSAEFIKEDNYQCLSQMPGSSAQ